MSSFIVLRPYKRKDKLFCKILLKNGIMENVNRTFIGLFFTDVTLIFTIILLSIASLLLGMPIYSCLIGILMKVIAIYIMIYINFWFDAKEIQKEVSYIPRIYMSDNSSHFWVAELYEYTLLKNQQHNQRKFMTEIEFKKSNIDVSRYDTKIVGTIALCKSNRLENCGWIKRLCVHKDYRRKGIGINLVNVALRYGNQQGYRRINVIISKHRKAAKELLSNKGFELYLYRKRYIYKTPVMLLFVELSYRLKYIDNDDELLATDPIYVQARLNN